MGGYLAAAVAVFAAGAGLGWLLIGGVSLSALAAFGTEASLFPSRITVRTILVNNLLALAVVLSGVVTFAVTTVVSLLFNGLLIGFFLGAAPPRRRSPKRSPSSCPTGSWSSRRSGSPAAWPSA
jgi:uncharacterized membrane protein SpoIIM required for sporulation